MKRTFALVILLAALGVLSKLAFKPVTPGPRVGSTTIPEGQKTGEHAKAEIDVRAELDRLFATAPVEDRALIARVGDRFRQNAL